MKYKLIHTDTGEIHLCDKIVIDGFDYYTVDFDENLFVIGNYILFKNVILNSDEVLEIKAFNEGVLPGYLHKYSNSLSTCYNVRIGHYLSFPEFLKDCKHVIATNNPNIDIPKVVDEVEKLAWNIINNNSSLIEDREQVVAFTAFYEGYNKAKEIYSNSNEDMIEFYKWVNQPHPEDKRQPTAVYVSHKDFWWYNHNKYTSDELIQIWKDQKPKIIYYA